MKKWIFATLMTAAMFATHAGSGNAQPAPSNQDETGTCSYTCSGNGRTYLNRTQCQAACAGAGVCVVEAC
jgi:hypothetical protein